MSRPPGYDIIYNWDGAPHGYSPVPQSMEQFLEKTYAPLEDTQVGAHFWCIGQHSARWPSTRLEQVGEVHGRHYENASSYTHSENIRQMLERGEDPQQALVERGQQLGLHVYASIRMNDNHFNGAQLKDLQDLHHTELTRMRIEHPEWLLGDSTSEWFALSWNFEVPEIRQHRFQHIEEICSLYDWDGVELDWQRHAFHLPEDEAYRLRYVLTDLQRSVRNMTRELGQKRGRPFYLAARVASTLEICARIGYDVPRWVEEDLVDILIPAGNAATDPAPDVKAFAALCRNTGVALYPGFDGGLPDPFVGPEDPQTKDRLRTRAIASRHHFLGANGIYAFNWHANRDSRRELLRQVGSPATLQRRDKVYAATHRFLQHQGDWRGAYRNDRIWGQVPVRLKQTFAATGPVINLEIGDDFKANPPEKLALRLHLDQWVNGDEIGVKWRGTELDTPEIRYDTSADTQQITDVSTAVWLCFPLMPEQVVTGTNSVEVILQTRNPLVACDIVLTDVELLVTYTNQ